MADIFKWIFLNENVWISIEVSLKFVPKGPINNIPALVQIMAWRRPGDKPLSEPMMISLLTHICVTRPQWVNLSTAPLLQKIIKLQAELPAPGPASQARDGAANNNCGLWVQSFHCVHQSQKVFVYRVHISETQWHDRFPVFYLMPHNPKLAWHNRVHIICPQ